MLGKVNITQSENAQAEKSQHQQPFDHGVTENTEKARKKGFRVQVWVSEPGSSSHVLTGLAKPET